MSPLALGCPVSVRSDQAGCSRLTFAEDMRRATTWFILILVIGSMAAALWYRVAPRVIASSMHPRGFSEIRIVETPTSFLDGLLFRYNPTYRFEYRFPPNYLWSATSFSGESYNARSSKIEWVSDSEAICYLDNLAYAKLVGREWINPRK